MLSICTLRKDWYRLFEEKSTCLSILYKIACAGPDEIPQLESIYPDLFLSSQAIAPYVFSEDELCMVTPGLGSYNDVKYFLGSIGNETREVYIDGVFAGISPKGYSTFIAENCILFYILNGEIGTVFFHGGEKCVVLWNEVSDESTRYRDFPHDWYKLIFVVVPSI